MEHSQKETVLAEDSERARVVGQIFEPGTLVEIDGRHFERCVFDNCVFVYRGGQTPVLEGSITNGEIRFQFEDAARNTIEVLRWMRAAAGQSFIEQLLVTQETPAN